LRAPEAVPFRSRPRSHPHRLPQHEAYAAPLVLAAQRARRGADEKRRVAAALEARAQGAAAAAVALERSAAADAAASTLPHPDASRRRALLRLARSDEAAAAAAAAAAALSAAREAEAAAAVADAADAAVRADQAARRSLDVAARRAARLLLRAGLVRPPAEGGAKAQAFAELLALSAPSPERVGVARNARAAAAQEEDIEETPAERALLRAEGPFSRAGEPHRPAVDDWECLRAMVRAWDAARGALGCAPVGGGGGGAALGQYAMRHTRLLAALCNAGVHPPAFAAAVAGVPCSIASAEAEAAALVAAA